MLRAHTLSKKLRQCVVRLSAMQSQKNLTRFWDDGHPRNSTQSSTFICARTTHTHPNPTNHHHPPSNKYNSQRTPTTPSDWPHPTVNIHILQSTNTSETQRCIAAICRRTILPALSGSTDAPTFLFFTVPYHLASLDWVVRHLDASKTNTNIPHALLTCLWLRPQTNHTYTIRMQIHTTNTWIYKAYTLPSL